MKKSVHKNQQGNREMPLPFRSENVCLPNNRSLALSRLDSLVRSFKRRPKLKEDYCEFMRKIIDRGHATPIPPNEHSYKPETFAPRTPGKSQVMVSRPGQVWYLPHFGVYHPRKPGQIRVVFDSSAEFKGTSLNKELLPGPDLMNSLVGVLFRFRHHEVGIMADIEQMFHSFHVNPKHRDFLRFLWFEDNDPTKKIKEYHITVHLFGNGPSPVRTQESCR